MTFLGPTARRWTARLALAATTSAIGLVATGAVFSPASADDPVKVGWWNFASNGGTAVPAPDVSAGGLRVAVASQQTVAYGAVEYQLPKDGTATLTLSITAMTGNASAAINTLVACPTTSADWSGGDDQDWSKKPDFNCDTHQFVGQLSSDGKSMLFNLDGGADITDGTLSLAIVPQHTTQLPAIGTDPGTGTDVTPPFNVDFDKPSGSAFAPSGGSSSDSGAPAPFQPSGSTGSSAPAGGSVPAAPPATGGDVSIPATTADAPGQSPVVAGAPTSTGTGTGATVPAAAVAPVGAKDDNKRNLLLVLLVLVLFGILYTQNATARVPRAIGPRSRSGAGDAAAAATAAAAVYPTGHAAPRGLGRFAKQRTEPARPLI